MFQFLLHPVRPAYQSFRNYSWRDFPHDLMAGLTVAVVDLPQSMAFAIIAGVPPVYGIYTAIIQGLLGGLFTSSAFLSNGPTNTQSLLVAAIVGRLNHASPQEYLALVICLTLIKGILQLIFAAASLGTLVRYVSNSVMVGFTAGAGVLILIEQIPQALGVIIYRSPEHLPGLPGAVQRLWPVLDQCNPKALAICVGCLLLIILIRRLSRFAPGPLLAVVGSAFLVWFLGWDQTAVAPVRVINELPWGLPRPSLPQLNLEMIEKLLPGAFAVAILGMLESVSIAKAIALRTHHHVDANQEFLGQGLSNIISSFFQCMPGSGSFSRSALQYAAGARTRMCSVVSAVTVTVIFLLLARQARFIPLAALAAILFLVGWSLIDFRSIHRMVRANRYDTIVCLITFLSAILLPLSYAIYVGIFLNLALYLHQASRLHIAEMVQASGGIFLERPLHDRHGEQRVVFLQVEGDLFFGVADELQERLGALVNSPVRVVILRLKRTHSIDATALSVFEQFAQRMKSRGAHVILCGVKPELIHTMTAYGLVDVLGKENVFATGIGVFTSAKRALARAKQLVGSSLDIAGLDVNDEPETWAYEI